MSSPRSAGTTPAPLSVGETDSVMVDNTRNGLRIPDFARDLSEPLTLTEKLVVKRKPRPVALNMPGYLKEGTDDTQRKRPRFSNSPSFGILINLSDKFTLRSLQAFGKNRFDVVCPKLKILALNENSKGRIEIEKDSIVSITSLGVVRAPSNKPRPDFMTAYGTKSLFDWKASEWELYNRVFDHFVRKFWSPIFQKQSSTESKFGGGLGGRKSASTPVIGKYCLRGKHSELSKLSEEDLKRKGVVSSERVGDNLILRFARIEQRDFACDSFILVVSFIDQSVTVGISRLRLNEDEEALVLIENWDQSLPEKFVPSVTLESFFH
jgi:hypothetical protein